MPVWLLVALVVPPPVPAGDRFSSAVRSRVDASAAWPSSGRPKVDSTVRVRQYSVQNPLDTVPAGSYGATAMNAMLHDGCWPAWSSAWFVQSSSVFLSAPAPSSYVTTTSVSPAW